MQLVGNLRYRSVSVQARKLDDAIMALLTGPFPVHYILAQFVATGTVLVWSFSSYRLWAFRTPAPDDRSPNS